MQRQLKHTTLELLRVYLKGKHPLKRDAEISELLNKRVEGVVLEEEWVDIVKYMYAPEDATLDGARGDNSTDGRLLAVSDDRWIASCERRGRPWRRASRGVHGAT